MGYTDGKYRQEKNKITAGGVILFALFAAVDGAGAARVIWKIARAYLRQKEKEGVRARGVMGYAAFNVAMSRLKKDGLVESGGWGLWRITKKGKDAARFLTGNKDATPLKKKGVPDTVVVFDVPEKERGKRKYLRYKLVSLGFELLQKSVWIGIGPIPADFIEYLRRENLLSRVHILGIRKAGTVSKIFE